MTRGLADRESRNEATPLARPTGRRVESSVNWPRTEIRRGVVPPPFREIEGRYTSGVGDERDRRRLDPRGLDRTLPGP